MNEVLYAFEPNVSEYFLHLVLGIITFIICTFLFIYSLKKHKQLLLLFSGFIGVTALGIAVFSFITPQSKLSTVQLYKNGLSTPEGKLLSFDDIRKIELAEEEKHSKFPIQKDGKMIAIDTLRLILIEEYTGKAHVLSEYNYPLDEVYEKLSILIKDYQIKNKAEENSTNPE